MSPVGAIARRVGDAGINTVYSPGWEGRSNGQSWPAGGPKGFILHHTAGGNNIYIDQNLISGVPGLSGPLCNFCIMYDGDLGVISNGPANHAGASGGWDTEPLPVTGMFNREVLGVEIQYKGTEPMSAPQYNTMLILCNAVMDEIGKPGQFQWVKTHNGTSVQGKWDPGYAPGKTYDIAAMRRDMANKVVGDDPKTWDSIMLQLMGDRE